MGVQTFLFTDIEGSTRLATALGDSWPAVLSDHHRICRTAFARHGGEELGSAGDGFAVAFADPAAALVAAAEVQRGLALHDWPVGAMVRVRAGLHTGTATRGETGWVGLAIHQAARISAAAHGGQVLLSSATADMVTQALPAGAALRDLGRYRLRDVGEPVRLFQLLLVGVEDDVRLPRSLDPARHNLPEQLTTFVGRKRESTAISKRLTDTRLVTLVGPGGVGKSRLAIQVGAALIDRYRGGVWLVELAPVSESRLVELAVATALSVRDEPLRPLREALAERIGSEPTLLLLDNCERVLDGAAAVAVALLARCSGLVVLATSVEPLRLPGEVLEHVGPLPIGIGHDPDSEGARISPAAQLFLDRAVAVDPTFTLDARTIAAVDHLCEQLDGLPLAIELAAARAATLTPEQLNDRLSDRFSLLAAGPRSVEARHSTLRAVVDWSVALLSPVERVALDRLCVFRGGCTLEAAEETVAGDVVARNHVVDALAGLVDRSLIVVQGAGRERRYSLLETIRAYGEERLDQASVLVAARDRHLSWVASLAAGAEPESSARDQGRWFDRLGVEFGNVRAALDWSVSSPERARRGLTIANQLLNFWLARGLRYEGIAWVERLVRLAEADPRERVDALFGAGLLAGFSWPASGHQLARAATELAGDDPLARGTAAVLCAFLDVCSGDVAAARRACSEATQHAGQIFGDSPAGLWFGGIAAFAALPEDPRGALQQVASTRRRFEDVGDVHVAGFWSSVEGLLQHAIGNDHLAATAVTVGRQIADDVRCPSCRSYNLTVGSLLPGLPLSARAADVMEALQLSDAINETMDRVEALRACVVLAGEANLHDGVARLAGAVEAVARQAGYGMISPGLSDGVARASDSARVGIGAELYEQARASGAALGYPEVVALARALCEKHG